MENDSLLLLIFQMWKTVFHMFGELQKCIIYSMEKYWL